MHFSFTLQQSIIASINNYLYIINSKQSINQ